MREVKAVPSISPRSREIAFASKRFSQPIFSPKRYKAEFDFYMGRKQEAERRKWQLRREKEMQEEEAMATKRSPKAYIPKTEFLRKYFNQVRIWEQRIVDKGPPSPKHNYIPSINTNSKAMAQKVERIDKRMK